MSSKDPAPDPKMEDARVLHGHIELQPIPFCLCIHGYVPLILRIVLQFFHSAPKFPCPFFFIPLSTLYAFTKNTFEDTEFIRLFIFLLRSGYMERHMIAVECVDCNGTVQQPKSFPLSSFFFSSFDFL